MSHIILANSSGGVGMQAAVEAWLGGQAALDVVEAGIRPVELDPTEHSVGVGGRANLLGQVELDASIMDGKTLRSGAVGALRGYLHPISVARQVMERLPHVFLVGEGAARFAAECGAEAGETLTDEARQEWDAWLQAHVPPDIRAKWPDVPLAEWSRLTADPALSAVKEPAPSTGSGQALSLSKGAGGTTTFLVKDSHGDIASGVSTCGWAYKYPGRLGDSPVIGAGIYADNHYGAAACTGMGELAIRAGTTRAVVLYMKMGMSVQEACHEAVADLRALQRSYQGSVTIHAIDAGGQPYVVSVGRDLDTKYWIWAEGMATPQERRAVSETW
jgi:L-asparaginase